MYKQKNEAVQELIHPTHHIDAAQNVRKQQESNNEQYLAFVYSTVSQFVNKYPAFTTGSIRALIFNENINGLAKSGAIKRIGRKVLIEDSKFFAWIESQNQGGK